MFLTTSLYSLRLQNDMQRTLPKLFVDPKKSSVNPRLATLAITGFCLSKEAVKLNNGDLVRKNTVIFYLLFAIELIKNFCRLIEDKDKNIRCFF